MEIELCAVSGYTQVTRNMSAIRVDDEVIIIDMGMDIGMMALHETEEGNGKLLSTEQLISIGAVPDDKKIEDWKSKVKAIVLGHCHLDHIAAVRYLASKYKCPIIGTPYTIEVLKATLRDDEIRLPNRFIKIDPDSKMKLSENIILEFVTITHSTLQCSIVVLHTEIGDIVYGNDFKFDANPVLGKTTNFLRLKEIGNSGKVIALIVESMYAHRPGHTPDELKAKDMLIDTIVNEADKEKAIFVTMFSSHIARIKSAIEAGEKIKRKVMVLGRSMAKYIRAGENAGLIKFSKSIEIGEYGSQRKRLLKELNESREKFLVVCTGGQGEPGSILDKIVNKQLPFIFKEGDLVIFSCSVIPQPINRANRERLEKILDVNRVKIYRDIHSSGHASAEDLRDIIKLLKPKHLIPSQGESFQLDALVKISEEEGYKLNKNVHLLKDGERLILN